MGKAIGKSANVNISSNQIKWDGPDIPCLELCTGDTISSVMYKIAEQVCSLVKNLDDLKTIKFDCLLDCPGTCPKDYSLKAIIEVLLANDCKLKDLIDSISTQVSTGNIPLSLNLECLVPYLNALLVSPTDYTLNDLLQSFVNIICDHETKIEDIINRIQSLEVLINNLQNIVIVGSYTEPLLTSCLNTTPTLHSALTPIIAQFACDIRTDLGTATQVASAIANQCLTDYSTNLNIIPNASSLAEDNLNKWIVICDLLSRIKYMEDNCCAPTCDDISIGFSALYNETTHELTLTFGNNTGTSIPLGFFDNGSTITLTDISNNTIVLPIQLSNGLIWTSVPLSLDFSHPVDVEIHSSLKHQINNLICIDTFTQTIPAQNVGCKLCKLCAVGGNNGDKISVTYTTLSNTISTTVTLDKGACISFELPFDTPIISNVAILTAGSTISLTQSSDCPATVVLPPVTAPTCWFFPLPANQMFDYISGKGTNCAFTNDQVELYIRKSDSHVYKYTNIETVLGTIPLSGQISDILSSGNNAITNGTEDQEFHMVPKNPTYTSPLLDCLNKSGSVKSGQLLSWGTFDPCSGGGPNTSDFPLYQSASGSYGISIKIVGQPTNVSPILEMLDPKTNQKFYSKGSLSTTCSC